jgi:hypothetical protein
MTYMLLSLAITGCNHADLRPHEHERTLLGYWQSNKDRYLEFDKDRTGKECLVMYRNQRRFLPPKLTFDIQRWQLRGDTLVIDFISETPLFSGKLARDSTNHPGTEYFTIDQKDNDSWVIKNILQGTTFKVNEEFKRVERIPENN